ncbi:transcriptional repressor, partial [Methylophilaceae bacterium]|nr:transcriptional repressor [Methylophilaceae bacterium]
MEDHVDFKKTGLKATIPRLRVLNIFENNREKHLSAEEIY